MMTSAEFADIVIPAALVVLVSIGAFVLAEAQRWLKARTTALEFQIIQTLVDNGVRAAMQLVPGTTNEQKKAFVVDFMHAEIEQRGLHIDDARLSAWIEGAVARMKDAR